MQKENFLGKIVPKDYSYKLERILETKDFSEDVKNLLLAILYKLEISYNDYKNVKRSKETKQEYIERILKTIKNDCNQIIIARPNTEEMGILGGRTFLVDKENKRIICYPIERKLLYCISKISKSEEIVRPDYFLLSKTISTIINVGNNINTVEPLRDFNGWSWNIVRKEIENISCNLIYQNLRILLGDNFLNKWIENTEYLIDYYSEFKNELKEKFNSDVKDEIISLLEKISIFIEIETNKEFAKKLVEQEEELKKQLEQFENKEEFIENIIKEKKRLNLQINKIEKIISDKQLLEEEYKTRNDKLPLDKKIFSKKVLEKILKVERQELLEELEEKNELLNPAKFIKQKVELEEKLDLLSIINIQNKEEEKNKILEDFQKIFLKCFFEFVKKAKEKEEIIDLIYSFRYYNMIPFNSNIDIYQNSKITKELENVEKELIKKAIDLKIITKFSEQLEENVKILKNIFKTKIISLEDLHISIIKEKNKYCIEFAESTNKSYEERFEIDSIYKEKLKVKLNKNIKIFI